MDAVIGVIGTILGTILGWVLNSLSTKGKLKIYVSSWIDNFQYNDAGSMVPCKSKEQTEYYHYDLTLDVYNSSSETKILRNIKIEFGDGKNILHISIPKDNASRHRSGPSTFYDNIVPLNVPPKTIIQLKLHDGAWRTNGGLDFIWNTQIVHLTYDDENGKKKRIIIKKENYNNYFNAQ